MSFVPPETFAARLVALLAPHPALARFSIRVAEGADSLDAIAQTKASAKKGEIWVICPEGGRSEETLDAAETYSVVTDEFEIAVIDGKRGSESPSAALAAVDTCLRAVRVAGATEPIQFRAGFARVQDVESELALRVWIATVAVLHDRNTASPGYTPASIQGPYTQTWSMGWTA